MTLRKRIFDMIEEGSLAGLGGSVFRAAMVATITISTACLIFLEDGGAVGWLRQLSAIVEGIALVVFLIEYTLRIWSCPEDLRNRDKPPAAARLRYVLSGYGLIDLIAMVPLPVMLLSPDARRLAIAIGLVRCIKLIRYSASLQAIVNTVAREKSALLAGLFMICAVAIIAGGTVSALEAARQPEKFGTIASSIWWAIETIVGSSTDDISPDSNIGRGIAALLTVFGFMMLALPVGIVSASFENSFRQRDFTISAGMVSRVALFNDFRADEIVTVVSALRSRRFETGDVIIKKGEVGHEMFFIVDGTVEVQTDKGSFALAKGEYFGERALVKTEPRNSTIVAAQTVKTLSLDKTTLYDLIRRRPEIEAHLLETIDARETGGAKANTSDTPAGEPIALM